ncbi:hypothetical protein D9M69_495800 [compost metagenome]
MSFFDIFHCQGSEVGQNVFLKHTTYLLALILTIQQIDLFPAIEKIVHCNAAGGFCFSLPLFFGTLLGEFALGKNGRYSFIRSNGNGSSATIPDRHVFPVLRVQARRWWPCTVQRFWCARILKRVYC